MTTFVRSVTKFVIPACRESFCKAKKDAGQAGMKKCFAGDFTNQGFSKVHKTSEQLRKN